MRKSLRWLSERFSALYLAALSLAAAGTLFYQPIAAGDADLWHHLNAGRYMFAHHAVPRASFFSFLFPPRVYHDYHWLFQITAYSSYLLGGYYGLLILRTVMFSAALLAVGLLLFGRKIRRPSLYGCIIFTFCALFLQERYMLVRPHIFSYFLIPLFLAILESDGKWWPALPPLALLWGNLHGIECPAICLILGSYMAESLLRLRPESSPRNRHRLLAWCSAAMVCMFVTPQGWWIFQMIWFPVDYVHRVIGEMHVMSVSDFASVYISSGVMSADSFFNALLILAGLSFIAAIARRRFRVSHFLLLVGGLCMLTRANRMRFDCMLLLLPLLKTPPFNGEAAAGLFPPPARAAFYAGLAVMTALYLKPMWEYRPHYPYSGREIPHGVVSFLLHVDTGGKIWNDPNPGGYEEWMLYPHRYLIASDDQNLHLFSQADLYMGQASFTDPTMLCRVVARYDPDYFIVPLQAALADAIASQPDYVPVFFDDTSALYVNRRLHPQVAADYALSANLFRSDYALPDPDPGLWRAPMPQYLARMLLIDPGSMITRARAVAFCARAGDFKGELAQAGEMIRYAPENRFGYLAAGDALRRLGRLDEAMPELRRALARTESPVGDDVVLREMAEVYQARGQSERATRILEDLDPNRPPKSWPLVETSMLGPASECAAGSLCEPIGQAGPAPSYK